MKLADIDRPTKDKMLAGITLLAGGVSPAFLALFQMLLVRATSIEDFERLEALHAKVFPQ